MCMFLDILYLGVVYFSGVIFDIVPYLELSNKDDGKSFHLIYFIAIHITVICEIDPLYTTQNLYKLLWFCDCWHKTSYFENTLINLRDSVQ